MTILPVLMLANNVESHCTVLHSENWALGMSSGSPNIIMESIPNNLVGQVNFSNLIDESIYGQKTPILEQIDTKGFLMDFGSFDHA